MNKWIHGYLADVTSYQKAGGTPSVSNPAFYDGDIPFVIIEDMTNSYRFLTKTEKKLTLEGVNNSSAWLVPEGHILYSMYATVGKPVINKIDCATNQAIIALKASDKVNSNYLFYWLEYIKPSIWKYTTQTTQSNLNAGVVRRLPVSYPEDKNVQERISQILTVVDDTIEKTQCLIHKYQKIKNGMMHDLFTRGLEANGRLRPKRELSPELYKKTPLGWIPNDWIFSTCSNVCEKIIDCKNRTPQLLEEGYPVIRTPNVRNGEFVTEGLVYTDFQSFISWTARGKPIPGDIVITREAPVGEVCKIPSDYPDVCLGQRMMLYRTDKEKIDNDYFLYVLQSDFIQKRLDLISGGSTVGHVRVGDIKELWIVYPMDKGEQRKIAATLNAITKKITSLQLSLVKIKRKKNGIMSDLLTGKVSVQSKQEEIEATHV